MSTVRIASVAAFVAASVLAILAADPAAAQSRDRTRERQHADGPPACSAISFRPVEPGLSDGEHVAGMYRSRFGKIEIVAEVKAGEARNYVAHLNGKKVDPLKGPLPASVDPCLQSKNVKTPVKPVENACTGTRFRVVIDRSATPGHLVLVALRGKEWRLCSASTI